MKVMSIRQDCEMHDPAAANGPGGKKKVSCLRQVYDIAWINNFSCLAEEPFKKGGWLLLVIAERKHQEKPMQNLCPQCFMLAKVFHQPSDEGAKEWKTLFYYLTTAWPKHLSDHLASLCFFPFMTHHWCRLILRYCTRKGDNLWRAQKKLPWPFEI